MKLLVLGGTLFLGRHIVEAALERGHQATLFNRGRTNPNLFPEAEHLRGDRDGDLSALEGRTWDAVVDPSGYVPRVVRASAHVLAEAAAHYTFVSSISVYRDFARIGITEDYPLDELPEESEDVDRYYGPLKAACEDVVRERFGERAHPSRWPHRRPLRLDQPLRLVGAAGRPRRRRPRSRRRGLAHPGRRRARPRRVDPRPGRAR